MAPGRTLTKLEGPAVAIEDLGHIDAVLLSHDQHVDNLDPAGRTYLASAPRTFSIPAAAGRLAGRVTGLMPWQVTTLDGDGASAAAQLLPDAEIVPVHFRGWGHFTQGGDAIRASFEAAALGGRLHVLEPGATARLPLSTSGRP